MLLSELRDAKVERKNRERETPNRNLLPGLSVFVSVCVPKNDLPPQWYSVTASKPLNHQTSQHFKTT